MRLNPDNYVLNPRNERRGISAMTKEEKKGFSELYKTFSNSEFFAAATIDEWRQCNLEELPPSYRQGNFEHAGYLVWNWMRWQTPNGELSRRQLTKSDFFALGILVQAFRALDFSPRNWANIGLAFLSYQTNLEITKKN